jgi:hypothetical protein
LLENGRQNSQEKKHSFLDFIWQMMKIRKNKKNHNKSGIKTVLEFQSIGSLMQVCEFTTFCVFT